VNKDSNEGREWEKKEKRKEEEKHDQIEKRKAMWLLLGSTWNKDHRIKVSKTQKRSGRDT